MKISFKTIAMLLAVLCFTACDSKKSSDTAAAPVATSMAKVNVDENEDENEDENVNDDVEGDEKAPDFTLESIDGSTVTLRSLRGKYVVLDFWGSWCGWCIKGFPDMKKYYRKYSDKLTIVGIDCNDTDREWRKAVKRYELPWIQLRATEDDDILDDYGIEGFPTKIVLDKKGNVLNVVEGEDPEFYDYLDELLG